MSSDPEGEMKTDRDEGMMLVQAMLEGGRMSEADICDLESRLSPDSDTLVDRVKVLGFFAHKGGDTDAERLQHILWIINNHPDISKFVAPLLTINDPSSAEYARVKEAWLIQLKERPAESKILINAASCFRMDDDFSLQLLNQAQALKPDDLEIEFDVAHQYRRSAQLTDDSESAQKKYCVAWQKFENILSKTEDDQKRFYELTDVATTAFGAEELERADEIAREMLRIAPVYESDWNFGNATYWANIILGKIAFSKGDVQAAGDHLISASLTKGSPQLDSYGPEFVLCSQLLKSGKSDCAKLYLENCGRFWANDKLSEWALDIEKGVVPSFEKKC